jgi:hypothetical protein
VYVTYYPDHVKRLHLFGEVKKMEACAGGVCGIGYYGDEREFMETLQKTL